MKIAPSVSADIASLVLVTQEAPPQLEASLMCQGGREKGLMTPLGKIETSVNREVTEMEYASSDGRRIPCVFLTPKGDSNFPVIVFAHGAMGSGDMGLPIVQRWTSHGYVVLCPTHADSTRLRRAQGRTGAGDTLSRIRINRQGGWDENCLQRPRDVSFVLDSLDEIEANEPALKGNLDLGSMAVARHSLGAYIAQVAGGATVKVPGKDEPRNFRDPRLKAILQLSGPGTDQEGLHKDSWKDIRLPMRCVTGSRDFAAQGQGPIWQPESLALSPPGEKYILFIEGAHHGSFNGKMAEGEVGWGARGRLGASRGAKGGALGDQKAIFELVKQATTAFWDTALENDLAAQVWLGSPPLAGLLGGKAKPERK